MEVSELYLEYKNDFINNMQVLSTLNIELGI
jgi:hypothetical protein